MFGFVSFVFPPNGAEGGKYDQPNYQHEFSTISSKPNSGFVALKAFLQSSAPQRMR
jgi:hypothetical protein